jgi:hypothetical protein
VRDARVIAVAAGLVLGALALAAGEARAQLVVEIDPTLGAGVTDNAESVAAQYSPHPDELVQAGVGARLGYAGARVTHSFGYRLTGRWFVHGHGPSSLSNNFLWTSTEILSARWTLSEGATASLASTSVFQTVDSGTLATAMPQIVPAGQNLYLSVNANETLTYAPNPRRRYSQSIFASRVVYLHAVPGTTPPQTTSVAAFVRGEWDEARGQYNADLTATTLFVDQASLPSQGLASSQVTQWLLLQGMVGRRLDLTPAWMVEGRVGFVGMFLLDGIRGIIAPGALLGLNYKRLTWFANLTFQQSASPSIYTGDATLGDTAVARLALPLVPNEGLLVGGFGGYTYARISNAGGTQHAYDQQLVGAVLATRGQRVPFYASLEYTFTNTSYLAEGYDQHVRRQLLMLTVGTAFVFGPGQANPLRGIF